MISRCGRKWSCGRSGQPHTDRYMWSRKPLDHMQPHIPIVNHMWSVDTSVGITHMQNHVKFFQIELHLFVSKRSPKTDMCKNCSGLVSKSLQHHECDNGAQKVVGLKARMVGLVLRCRRRGKYRQRRSQICIEAFWKWRNGEDSLSEGGCNY